MALKNILEDVRGAYIGGDLYAMSGIAYNLK